MKKREEEALMNFKLGIKDPLIVDCTEVKQVLEAVRSHFIGEKQGKPASTLNEFEIKEMTQKESIMDPNQKAAMMDDDPELALQNADRVQGIGFEKRNMVSTSVKGMQSKTEKNLNKLSGENTRDLKYLDQQKKLTMINFLTEKLKRDKEAL